MPHITPLFLLLVFCLTTSHSNATQTLFDQKKITLETVKQKAQSHKLALESAWHDLIHYRNRQFWGPKVSQADDPRFFLSPEGATSPEAELMATVDAIFSPQETEEHAICRFPARFNWIKLKLNLDNEQFPAPPCQQLNEWMTKLNTASISLIFASSYLNSPSSMFGHTFLRLDQPDQAGDNLLLANTISYSADAADHDSELMFAYRGIFGGYPGVTGVTPYYDKIKVYTDLENRDIWEYRLNFTPTEVKQLLWHAWEIQHINFDYYFFDENCAYRILSLLDVARPGLNLTKEFPVRAIPSDTVRAIVKKELPSQITYRPSASTILKHRLSLLNEDQKREIRSMMTDGNTVSSWMTKATTDEEKARVLDAAYEYSRYLAEEEKLDQRDAAKLSYTILAARNTLPGTIEPTTPAEPDTRDDQGHETLRFGMSAGEQDKVEYIDFSIRPAYHDLLDPQDGYRTGSELTFLDSQLRYYPQSDQLKLNALTVIAITSLSEIDAFSQPLSWNVSTGAERITLGNKREVFTPFLTGGAGATFGGYGQLFGFINGRLEINHTSSKGFYLGPQIQLGWNRHSNQDATRLLLTHTAFMEGSRRKDSLISLEERFFFSDNWSIGGSWQRSRRLGLYETEWSLGIFLFY